MGPDSDGDDEATYRLEDRTFEAGVDAWATRFAEFGARARWLTTEAGAGSDDASLDERYGTATTPGFGIESNFFVYGARAALHLRDEYVLPSVGVTFQLDVERYDERDADVFDFTRIAGDLQAHIPVGHRNRIFALHVRSSHSVGED